MIVMYRLHRSEGFGYGAAEALIQEQARDRDGLFQLFRDFCTEETSLLVPYELTRN